MHHTVSPALATSSILICLSYSYASLIICIFKQTTSTIVSLPALLFRNHPQKNVVHSYRRTFFHLLKMFTGVALLIPGGHITNFGGALVSAALVESFQGGRHDDQTVSTLRIQCAILL